MKVFTILFIILSCCLKVKAQVIDETAATKYFELVENLKQGKNLSVDTWKAFLALEGNSLYIKNLGYDEAYLEKYRNTLEIVYRPQNDSILQRRLKDRERHYLTYVIYQYKAYEPELKEYLAQLASSKEEYLQAMYENCYLMLPRELHQKKPNSKLYFIGIENDAVAKNGDIVFTLWVAYNYDKVKKGALAGHEMHHLLRETKQYQLDEQDQALLVMLHKMLNEGGPDLIDKEYSMAPGFPEDLQFGQYFLETGASALPKVVAALTEIATGTKKYSRKELNKLIGSSGHIPGFYMAHVIARNGLKQKLVKAIQDPFQFVYLYNNAAQRDKTKPPVFSEQAITYLKRLEQRAITKK